MNRFLFAFVVLVVAPAAVKNHGLPPAADGAGLEDTAAPMSSVDLHDVPVPENSRNLDPKPGTFRASASRKAASRATVDLLRYRTHSVNPRIHRVPKRIQQGVRTDPEQFLGPLVTDLIDGVADPFQKVTILHDWVAFHVTYDVESFFSGKPSDASWETTLRRGQAVCYGYSKLLEQMCDLAGVSCVTISGFGRGFSFATARDTDASRTNHAWNAVQVLDRWYLVDTTWDAGHVEQRSFKKDFSHAYLFLEPKQFLYTHFPEDPQWQLLDEPLDAQQFADLPYLRARFFGHGLRILTDLKRSARVGAATRFHIHVPRDVVVSVQLKNRLGAIAERRTLIRRLGDQCEVLVTFPTTGDWKLDVFGKRRSDQGPLSLAATLEFQSAAGTIHKFPRTFGVYHQLDGCLYSPLHLPDRRAEAISFKIAVRNANKVYLVVGDQGWQKLTPSLQEKGIFRLTTTIAGKQPVSLVVEMPTGSKKYSTLVEFRPGRNGASPGK